MLRKHYLGGGKIENTKQLIEVFRIFYQQTNWPYLPNLPKGAAIVISRFRDHIYKYDLYTEF